MDKGTTVKSLYVRARDADSASGISTGTYYTFVMIGQNLDSVNSRFSQSAGYFRFQDPVVFTTCSSSLTFGSYQYLDITLNYKEGTGSDTISVPPDSFPKFGQKTGRIGRMTNKIKSPGRMKCPPLAGLTLLGLMGCTVRIQTGSNQWEFTLGSSETPA